MATLGHRALDPELLHLDGGIFSSKQLIRRSVDWNVWSAGLDSSEPADTAVEIPLLVPVDLRPPASARAVTAPLAAPATAPLAARVVAAADVTPIAAPPVVVPVTVAHAELLSKASSRRHHRLAHRVTAGSIGVVAIVGLAAASQLRGGPLHAITGNAARPAVEWTAPPGKNEPQDIPAVAAIADAPESAPAPAPERAETPEGHPAAAGAALPKTSPFATAQNAPHTVLDMFATPRQFSRAAAAIAIANAARGAAGCSASDDARVAMPVRVVYSPNGRVTSASVQGGPFMGTTAGGCIASVLRSAKIPSFEGESVAVNTTVRIR